MSRPLAVALILFMTSATAWAGPGTDFCGEMRQAYEDCHVAAMRLGADGQPAGDCMDVKNKMSQDVQNLGRDAVSEVRTQMQVSYQVWLSLANTIAHSGGMSADAIADLKRNHRGQINTECYKLQMMEY